MNFREFDAYVKNQVVKGFESGYKFQDFKTDEIVGVYTIGLKEDTPSLKEGTISHKFQEGKTRRIVVRLGGGVEHTIKGNQQIKNHLFKKLEFDRVEQAKNSPVLIFKKDIEEKSSDLEKDLELKNEFAAAEAKQEEKIIEEKMAEKVEELPAGDVETMIVERAMSPKNPTVKKYLAEGWVYKGKVWNSEKNMYLATLERRVG